MSVILSRPEGVMSARDGLALRSLVYHEILSAYLNYVKARGYTSMFIWACPPMAVSLSSFIMASQSLQEVHALVSWHSHRPS